MPVYRSIGEMSVPPQIIASLGVADCGSLAFNGISLSRLAGECDPNCSCRTFWVDERVLWRRWRVGDDGGRSAVLVPLTVAAHPHVIQSTVP
jgi:hypothetical protein